MQKLLRRTMLAEKQVARRLARRKEIKHRAARKNALEMAAIDRREEIKLIEAARIARRQDWEMGPLAPKREDPEVKQPVGPKNITTPKDKGRQFSTIRKGDRVVVIEGKCKGKIGKVMEMDLKTGKCTVAGLEKTSTEAPEPTAANQEDQDEDRTIALQVPFSQIRLVAVLRNAETGLLEDVICDRVEITEPQYIKKAGSRSSKISYKRFITLPDGTPLPIPFPRIRRKLVDESKLEDYPSDTLRLEVEQKTFVPTLLRPPMPSSVIDELRNRYSVFRTRHDPEYIAKKIKEEEEKEEKKMLIKKMRTPIKDINRLEKKMKKAKGKGKLTDDMLEKIGKVMAEKRQLQLQLAGMSKQEPSPIVA